jgi:hypothetical protein
MRAKPCTCAGARECLTHLADEQRGDATQIRDFTTGVKAFGARRAVCGALHRSQRREGAGRLAEPQLLARAPENRNLGVGTPYWVHASFWRRSRFVKPCRACSPARSSSNSIRSLRDRGGIPSQVLPSLVDALLVSASRSRTAGVGVLHLTQRLQVSGIALCRNLSISKQHGHAPTQRYPRRHLTTVAWYPPSPQPAGARSVHTRIEAPGPYGVLAAHRGPLTLKRLRAVVGNADR